MPHAGLTVMFFDERFNFIGNEGSTYSMIDNKGEDNYSKGDGSFLDISDIKAPKNGYVYIYVSNTSNEPVYFDNLQIAYERSKIIEEDHYYPFGLKIASISSRKMGDPSLEGHLDNKNLLNDKELDDEGDLNWYDYGYRNYDPQIGRFVQIDPLAFDYEFNSTYSYAINDPVNYIDKDGLGPFCGVADWFQQGEANPTAVANSASVPTGNILGSAAINFTYAFMLHDQWAAQRAANNMYVNASMNISAVNANGPGPKGQTQSDNTSVKTPVTKSATLLGNSKEDPKRKTIKELCGKSLDEMNDDETKCLFDPYCEGNILNKDYVLTWSERFYLLGEQGMLFWMPVKLARLANLTNKVKVEKAVLENFKRFMKKIPSNSKLNASMKKLDVGNYLFEATSPAQNIPGSKAVYQKWVDPKGATIKMIKTTYAPDGSIVHIKDKF